jgi:hypothetical protein
MAKIKSTREISSQEKKCWGGERGLFNSLYKNGIILFCHGNAHKNDFSLPAAEAAAQEEMDQISDWGVNWEKNGEAAFCTQICTCIHRHTLHCAHKCAHAYTGTHTRLQPCASEQAHYSSAAEGWGKSIIWRFLSQGRGSMTI